MRILMIHGRDQGGKNPDVLKIEWIQALKEGFKAINKPFPEDIQIDFPFYGDELEKIVNAPEGQDVRIQGDGQNREFEEFARSAMNQIKNNAQITNEEINAEQGGNIKEQDVQNWDWVQAVARVIDHHFTGVAEFTIEKFLRDVFLYVSKPTITKKINNIVKEKLTNEPTIVIGHSLGSVVGYKVILENLNTINLIKYITVGSPLGLRAISSKLGIPENPSETNGWYNAYDSNDLVALNPLDDEYFPTDPPVLNYDGVNNQTSNQHGIIGYLNDKDVAKAIDDALALCRIGKM